MRHSILLTAYRESGNLLSRIFIMTKKTSPQRGRPSKIRINRAGKQFRPCPCPIHQGGELPLTEKYWQRSAYNPSGWQGYCKQFRSKIAREYWKKKREENKVVDTEETKVRCRQCRLLKKLSRENFQLDKKSKSGFRQPCKKCIQVERKSRNLTK
jgi:hypothetical protein